MLEVASEGSLEVTLEVVFDGAAFEAAGSVTIMKLELVPVTIP